MEQVIVGNDNLNLNQIFDATTNRIIVLGERLRLLNRNTLNIDYLKAQTQHFFLIYLEKEEREEEEKEEEEEKWDLFLLEKNLLDLFFPFAHALRNMSNYFDLDIDLRSIIKKTIKNIKRN